MTATVLAGSAEIRSSGGLYRDTDALPQLSHHKHRTDRAVASFAPVVQPTRDTGTSALAVAAYAWLGTTQAAAGSDDSEHR